MSLLDLQQECAASELRILTRYAEQRHSLHLLKCAPPETALEDVTNYAADLENVVVKLCDYAIARDAHFRTLYTAKLRDLFDLTRRLEVSESERAA